MSNNPLGSLQSPSVQEFIDHPDRRQIAAFFLGWVFISGLTTLVYSPSVRSFLRRITACFGRPFSHATSPDVESLSGKSNASCTSLMRGVNDTLISVLSLCFVFASVAYFSSVLTFDLDRGASACAFVIAWGGISGGTARLLGLLVLSLELKRYGVPRWETTLFWALLGVGMGLTLATNAISIGIIKFVDQLDTSLCYREHFFPTSLASSLVYLLLECYVTARLFNFVVPRFLQLRHQVIGLGDDRILKALSLMFLDLLTIVPAAVSSGILGDYIPFSLGALAVLAAFNQNVPTAIDVRVMSIPPTPYDSRSKTSRMPSFFQSPRSLLAVPAHAYSVHSIGSPTIRPNGWPRSTHSSSPMAENYQEVEVHVASGRSSTWLDNLPSPWVGVDNTSDEKIAPTPPVSRLIHPYQAQYAERYEREIEARMLEAQMSGGLTPSPGLTPMRPAITINTLPSTPERSDDGLGTDSDSRSTVSSVVYGSDILRYSTKPDATKHANAGPMSIISPTSRYSRSTRDSFATSSGRSHRRFSWATVRQAFNEFSTQEEPWPRKARRTFGENSFKSMDNRTSYRSTHLTRASDATIPPLPMMDFSAKGLSSPRLPSTPRGTGNLRGPRPPPSSIGHRSIAVTSP